jgi:hypothetical protein
MTSPQFSSRQSHHRQPGPTTAARARAGALRAVLFLMLAWAGLTPSLARPALAAADGPTPVVPAATSTPEALPQRVFLPLTLIATPIEQEAVDLVAFTYRLQEGDDLLVLALEWGIDSEAISCVTRSGQEPLSGLLPGQVIMIPNPRYRCHTVQPGETVEQIAQDYSVAVETLLDEPWNQVETDAEALKPGRRLLILDGNRPDLASLHLGPGMAGSAALSQPSAPPDATPPKQPAVWPYGDGQFIWPLPQGVISQGFRAGHRALDIAAPIGTPVYAADNGIVLKSGYTTDGYGGRVIIDHQIDYITLYAHLSQALVEAGDVVQKGQLIGYVGSTGNSTGPHIHFELRDFGFLIDPRSRLTGALGD